MSGDKNHPMNGYPMYLCDNVLKVRKDIVDVEQAA